MLSTFFSTSKPIHYLIVLVTVTLSIIFSLFWSSQLVLLDFTAILIVPLVLAVFQFVVTKNDLTPSSTYALLTASVLSLLYLVFEVPIESLIAFCLVLLAVRKLLSLKSTRAAIKKIFDATFWVTIASIFYPWSSLFYIVVFIAIFLYVRNDYRNWVTPFIAVCCIWVLFFTYDYVWEIELLHNFWSSFNPIYLWDIQAFEPQILILFILLGIAVIGLLVYISKLVDLQQSVRPRFTIIMFTGLCGVAIAVLNFNSFTQGGFLFLIPSISVLWARFAHGVRHKILTELLLWFPVVILFWGLLLR